MNIEYFDYELGEWVILAHDEDGCECYKPTGTGECWNCGERFYVHY